MRRNTDRIECIVGFIVGFIATIISVLVIYGAVEIMNIIYSILR